MICAYCKKPLRVAYTNPLAPGLFYCYEDADYFYELHPELRLKEPYISRQKASLGEL